MPLKKTQAELEDIVYKLFADYKERKRTRTLYKTGLIIPKRLLMFYYLLDEEHRHLNGYQEEFVRHYIACESILENSHLKFEKQGLNLIYEYIFSKKIDENFDIYTLLDIHKLLFSQAPSQEFGGHLRNSDAHLDGVPIDLTPGSNVPFELKMLDYDLKDIIKLGEEVKNNRSLMFDYIDKCIELKCKLIKVHPFADGNGRTVRAFINKLFINVGLPPVYISSNEDSKYKMAMQKAIGEEGIFSKIQKFYYYKICDSIIELEYSKKNDISERTKINIITDIVQSCKKQSAHYSQDYSVDEKVADEIQNYCDEYDITSQILDVKFFIPELPPHPFVIIDYQREGKDKIKMLLADPTFESLFENVKPSKQSAMYENLKEYGITSISKNTLYNYLVMFGELSQKQASKQKVKSVPNH